MNTDKNIYIKKAPFNLQQKLKKKRLLPEFHVTSLSSDLQIQSTDFYIPHIFDSDSVKKQREK